MRRNYSCSSFLRNTEQASLVNLGTQEYFTTHISGVQFNASQSDLSYHLALYHLWSFD